MKFKYTETCAAGYVVLHGVKFPEGKAVEVDDPALIQKLENNSHFTAVKQRSKPVEAENAEDQP